MNISPKTITYAIHGIFAAKGIKPGGILTMQILSIAWNETRLRKVDLGRGLEALRKAGYVSLEKTAYGFEVRLLDDQFGQVVTEEDRRALNMLGVVRKLRQPPVGRTPLPPPTKPAVGRRNGDTILPA